MRIRRPAIIAAAAVAAIGLIAGGTYAFAGGDSDQTTPVSAESSEDPSSSAPGSTEPSAPDSSSPESTEPSKDTEDDKDDKKVEDAEDEKKNDHNCPTGENQKQVEKILDELGDYGPVVVDGRQSKKDCEAIKKFQTRFGIEPYAGSAGPLTLNVAKRINETDISKCDGDKGLVACVDLTHQTSFIMKDGEVIVGPTVVRTGMGGGYQTPAGKYEINKRTEKEWSEPYEVWLPWWQHFTNGMGFHETTTYIHDMGNGSHGCVNLLNGDAKKFYDTLKMGTTVHTFGRRPGT